MKKILFLFAITCSMLYSCSSSLNDEDDDLENVGTPGGSNPDTLKPTDIGYKFKESETVNGEVHSIPGITNGNSRKLKSIYKVSYRSNVPVLDIVRTFQYDDKDRLIEEKTKLKTHGYYEITDRYDYLITGEPTLKRNVKLWEKQDKKELHYDRTFTIKIDTYKTGRVSGDIMSYGQIVGWFIPPSENSSKYRRFLDFGFDSSSNYGMTTGNMVRESGKDSIYIFREYDRTFMNEFMSLNTNYEIETWEESNPFIIYFIDKFREEGFKPGNFIMATKVEKIHFFNQVFTYNSVIDYTFGKDSNKRILWKTGRDKNLIETIIYHYK